MTSRLIADVAAGVLVLVIAVTVNAAEFTGSWKGTLTGSDGSAGEVQVDFSPQGFPCTPTPITKEWCVRSSCHTSGRRWNTSLREAACNGWS